MAVPERPEQLITFDREQRRINSAIVVVGSNAAELLRYLHEQTEDKPPVHCSPPTNEATYHYLELRLGFLRGYQTCFHLYAFEKDERLLPMIEAFIPHARGLIIAAREAIEVNVRAAAESTRRLPRKLPVGLLAPEPSRREWSRIAGAPDFESAWSDEQIFPVLKVIAKGILVDLRDGDRPRKPWWKFW